MRKRLLTLTLLAAAVLPALAREGIVLMGDGYGRLEVETIVREVIEKNGLTDEYIPTDGTIPAEEYQRYRVVVIACELKERYTPEELRTIERSIEEGLRLVLIQQAPKALKIDPEAKDTPDAFLFGMSQMHHQQPRALVLKPDHPLIAGLFDPANADDPLLEARHFVMLRSDDFDNLIGSENFMLVGTLQKGKGDVIFLGHQLFRLLSARNETPSRAEAGRWSDLLARVLEKERP